MHGNISEFKQRIGPGVTFVIEAQPYLNAVPMPPGLEAIFLKTCTHYPTLFEHFQRDLRDVLKDLQHQSLIVDWRETKFWKLLKELTNSVSHRSVASKTPLSLHCVLGMDLIKVKTIQHSIDELTKQMFELLRVEKDAELLEITQEELNVVPTPECSQHIYRGLGGKHLFLFKDKGNHRLPPTNLSPGDMVCVRICDSRGGGAISCLQGFVNNLREDSCSISLALESRHRDPTFSKLFAKNIRIHGL